MRICRPQSNTVYEVLQGKSGTESGRYNPDLAGYHPSRKKHPRKSGGQQRKHRNVTLRLRNPPRPAVGETQPPHDGSPTLGKPNGPRQGAFPNAEQHGKKGITGRRTPGRPPGGRTPRCPPVVALIQANRIRMPPPRLAVPRNLVIVDEPPLHELQREAQARVPSNPVVPVLDLHARDCLAVGHLHGSASARCRGCRCRSR